jgi:hypothetical protein
VRVLILKIRACHNVTRSVVAGGSTRHPAWPRREVRGRRQSSSDPALRLSLTVATWLKPAVL